MIQLVSDKNKQNITEIPLDLNSCSAHGENIHCHVKAVEWGPGKEKDQTHSGQDSGKSLLVSIQSLLLLSLLVSSSLLSVSFWSISSLLLRGIKKETLSGQHSGKNFSQDLINYTLKALVHEGREWSRDHVIMRDLVTSILGKTFHKIGLIWYISIL